MDAPAAPEDRRRSALADWRRSLVYRLRRPEPLRHPSPIARPVVIVGSAPRSTRPEGFGTDFLVVTVNGSQSVAAEWGVDIPDVTLIQYNQIEGVSPNAIAVRGVLEGRRTKRLCVLRWKYGRARLERGLEAFRYRADEIEIVDRYRRMALFERSFGRINLESDNEQKFSNGVTGVLYALASGAPAVVISGIDPASKGHAYNGLGLRRLHADSDLALLRELCEKGRPLYTADSHVSESAGIPLWTAGRPETRATGDL